MQKGDLSKIYHIEREIMMWQAELEDLESESLISSPSFDVSGGSSPSPASKQEKRAINKMTIEQEIEKLQRELLSCYNEIVEWIGTLDDSYIRQVLYYRCVKGKSWSQVVDAMGYGTESGVRKAYERFVKKYFSSK